MENIQNVTNLEEERPNRCVLIMNENISGGYLANAIAVIALTVGERHPYLVGAPLVDASGVRTADKQITVGTGYTEAVKLLSVNEQAAPLKRKQLAEIIPALTAVIRIVQ